MIAILRILLISFTVNAPLPDLQHATQPFNFTTVVRKKQVQVESQAKMLTLASVVTAQLSATSRSGFLGKAEMQAGHIKWRKMNGKIAVRKSGAAGILQNGFSRRRHLFLWNLLLCIVV